MGQSIFFFIYGLKNYIETSDLVHTVPSTVLLFVMAGQFWPLGGHKLSERRPKQSSPPPESFLSFFSTCFEVWTWNLVYTPGRWHGTSSLSFITITPPPLESFPDIFSNGLRYQFESCFIHSVVCTTYWVHVSPEWGPCDPLHVLALAQLTNRIFTYAGKRAY